MSIGGLTLYDATFLHQRFARWSGRLLLGRGVEFPFRLRYDPPVPEWWEEWLATVAEPLVGPVAATTFRLPGSAEYAPRVTSLLFNENRDIVAFAKHLVRDQPSELSVAAQAELMSSPPLRFSIPRLLAEGRFEEMAFQVHSPLPAGTHSAPPADPGLIEPIIDELQERLAELPRPGKTPPEYVPVHRDFLAINLRQMADGTLWLIDWDNATWGPPLTDELAYWMGHLARLPGPTTRRRIRRCHRLLLRRGSNEQIRAALEWRSAHRPREALPGERRIADGLRTLME